MISIRAQEKRRKTIYYDVKYVLFGLKKEDHVLHHTAAQMESLQTSGTTQLAELIYV